MIYGTQDGWFPPITGPGPVMLVAYILVLYYVSTCTTAVLCHVYVQYPHPQPIFGVFICE